MNSKKAESSIPRPQERPIGLYAAAALAMMVFFWVYSVVDHTQFLFDDSKQVFATSRAESLRGWIGPVRPLLMLTYWVNNRMSDGDTYSYHVVNLLVHALSAVFVFYIAKKLLEWAGVMEPKRGLLAGFAGALFLLHPAQTESVAYIAGRSESLSGMFACASYAIFLYRRGEAISWPRVVAVVLLAMAAMLSKEQAVVLFAVFVLTDIWWNPGFSLKGLKRNWKLYVPLLAGAAGAIWLFRNMILGKGTGGSAGFGLKDFTWYQYLFTQFRAIWVYIGNFLFPANLNLDWEFPISYSIMEHGAIFGLVGLLAVSVAAWIVRRKYPLASYGWFLFLLFLAPTSSILPIKDPVADRRIYLPMIGLLLIVVDLVSRLKIERKVLATACAVVVAIAAAGTRARAVTWSDPIALWEDTASKSPGKSRVHFQLGFAYLEQQRYDRALAEFERTAALTKPDYDLLMDWALAYDGLHQPENALAKFREAAALEATAHVYSQIAKVYAQQAQWRNALDALEMAQRLDPNFVYTYGYRGLVYLAMGNPSAAVPEFQRALTLDPTFQPARDGLQQAVQQLRAPR